MTLSTTLVEATLDNLFMSITVYHYFFFLGFLNLYSTIFINLGIILLCSWGGYNLNKYDRIRICTPEYDIIIFIKRLSKCF
jgi:hypothetical protein